MRHHRPTVRSVIFHMANSTVKGVAVSDLIKRAEREAAERTRAITKRSRPLAEQRWVRP